MGLRIRKSINTGLGFKINLSKNGIGYSWGAPYYRKTWKASGGTRTTFSLPGTGVSYVEENNTKKVDTKKLPRSNSMERYNLENSKEYPVKNGKTDTISTEENKIFINKLKSILVQDCLTLLAGELLIFCLSFLSNVAPKNLWGWIFFIIIVAIIGLVVFINSRRFILLEYNLDKDISSLISQRDSALSYLFKSDKIWNIVQYQEVPYSRVNAGASINIKRKKVKVTYSKAPLFLKVVNDLKFYQMSIGMTRYIFLPDKILVIGLLQIGALKYHDIEVQLEHTQFIESEIPPKDAHFLYYTWQYVNNNGTPDRRFKGNKKIPVFAYKKILLKSASGLNIHLMVSSSSNAEMFKNKWDEIQEMF